LAHRGEVEPAHQLLRFHEAGAERRLHPNPVGLALAPLDPARDRLRHGGRDGRIGVAHAGQIAMLEATCHPSPPSLSAWRWLISVRCSTAIAAFANMVGEPSMNAGKNYRTVRARK